MPPAWLDAPDHLGVTVRRGPCPTSLIDGRRVPGGVTVAGEAVLVAFADGAVLVESGTEITVEWRADGDGPSWIVESWGIPIAMVQRGHLCLHATVVVVDGRVLILAGASGAGKSTTAMALQSRGHRLLTDDVAIIELGGDRPAVLPYRRNVHLLPDAATAVGLDIDDLFPLVAYPDKSAYRPDNVPTEPMPIDALVLLVLDEDEEGPTLRPVLGAEKLQSVLVHAGRPVTTPAIMGEDRYFAALTALAAATPAHLLTRSSGTWTLDEVCGLIEGVAATPR